mmetsp:Transcript_64402/g.188434  ORF Transcript_64402/g.188434 Transcript_64402/m.188434 type:complete len:245 (-) Transcript_64402:243-977(-)
MELAALLAHLGVVADALRLLGFGRLRHLDRLLPPIPFRLPGPVKCKPQARAGLLELHAGKPGAGLREVDSVSRDADLRRWRICEAGARGGTALIQGGTHYHLLQPLQHDLLRPRSAEEVQEQALRPPHLVVRLEGAALEEHQRLGADHGLLLAGAEAADGLVVLHTELLHVQQLLVEEPAQDEAERPLLRAGAESKEAVAVLLAEGLELAYVLEGVLRVLPPEERGEGRPEDVEVTEQGHDIHG